MCTCTRLSDQDTNQSNSQVLIKQFQNKTQFSGVSKLLMKQFQNKTQVETQRRYLETEVVQQWPYPAATGQPPLLLRQRQKVSRILTDKGAKAVNFARHSSDEFYKALSSERRVMTHETILKGMYFVSKCCLLAILTSLVHCKNSSRGSSKTKLNSEEFLTPVFDTTFARQKVSPGCPNKTPHEAIPKQDSILMNF